jgi:hypothetical protein
MTRAFDSTGLGRSSTEGNWQLMRLGCGSTAVLRIPLPIIDNAASLREWHHYQARSVDSGSGRRLDAIKRKPNKRRSNIMSGAWTACQMARRLLQA